MKNFINPEGSRREHAAFTRVNHGFTLIELLIVVAIIAILAAIAVPNFMEAQTRSKVSRTKSDHRTIVIACESYRVDNNTFPPNWVSGTVPPYFPCGLTTPIAYVTSIGPFLDVFRVQDAALDLYYRIHVYKFYKFECNRAGTDISPFKVCPNVDSIYLASFGPDNLWDWTYYYGPYGNGRRFITPPDNLTVTDRLYDPSNGTVSAGDIVRYDP